MASKATAASASPPIVRVPIPESIRSPIGNPDRVDFSEKNLEDIRIVAQRGLETSNVSTSKYIGSLPAKVLMSKTAYACEYGIAGGLIGAAAGAGIGAAAGCGAGAVPGALIGGGGGYVCGLIVGSIKVHRQTRVEFENWKKGQNAATIAEFRQMFKEHPSLALCLDPSSLEPMVLPAHCNCPGTQHTMEYETLSESLKRYNICPLDTDRRPAPKAEIRIDYRSLGVFNLAYAQLLQAGANKAKLNASLMKGVAALVDDLHRHRVYLFERENTDIQSKLTETMKRKVSNLDEMLAQGNEMMILSTRLNIITQLLFPKEMEKSTKSK